MISAASAASSSTAGEQRRADLRRRGRATGWPRCPGRPGRTGSPGRSRSRSGPGCRNRRRSRRRLSCVFVMPRTLADGRPRGSRRGGEPVPHPGEMNPDRYATTTAWVRSRTPSLVSTLPTWVLTVSRPSTRSAAISALDRPVGHQPQHLGLALGQPHAGQPRLGRAVRGGEPADRGREQQRVAAGHHPDRLDDLLRPGPLEQEPARPGPQRVVDVLVVLERGDDQHPRRVGRSSPAAAGWPGCRRRAGIRTSISTTSGRSFDRQPAPPRRRRRPRRRPSRSGSASRIARSPARISVVVVDDQHPDRSSVGSVTGSPAPCTRHTPVRPARPSSSPPSSRTRSPHPGQPAARRGAAGAAAPHRVGHVDVQRRRSTAIRQRAPGPSPCLAALVRLSCTIRYASRDTGAGASVAAIARPRPRPPRPVSSRSRSARVGCGAPVRRPRRRAARRARGRARPARSGPASSIALQRPPGELRVAVEHRARRRRPAASSRSARARPSRAARGPAGCARPGAARGPPAAAIRSAGDGPSSTGAIVAASAPSPATA